MTTLYLIRHSTKEKNYGIVDNVDSKQIQYDENHPIIKAKKALNDVMKKCQEGY